MSGDARTLIAKAANDVVAQVPALAPLKIVIDVQLQGRGDLQVFRLEMPQAEVTKDVATDAKIHLAMRREEFNRLVEESSIPAWRKAFETGSIKASGVEQYMKLITQVIDKQQSRAQLKRARH
ncbi:MAG: hypothetical protein NWQ82_03630 [Solirubrobacteraceae bacterium]|jgi:hypothetical protein|nr:hypothetical protein [Solirubrobacteraceae bacterium]MDP4672024.1 hypothetical protein [Solirubrobacteraceae bacterium]MDP4921041.1 hypothetical protein [Solirubrobacteraceae bacterium]